MNPLSTPIDQPNESTERTEARMRQALGLDKRPAAPHQATAQQSHDPSRQRRRFAQDGEVPVVMLHRSRDADGVAENKLATLTAELREERVARARAERALEEAQLTIQSLQTKVAHAGMMYEEKLGSERQLRLQAETVIAELTQRASQTLPPVAEVVKAAESEPSLPLVAQPDQQTVADRTPALKIRSATKRAPKPAASTEAEEAQPIEWWLPSFRASRKTPAKKKPLG
ncbi:hypothetical protein [Acidisoma cladoniae]|jgi:hypothetical protein|uniref:hypothetical protein n=1 Tax=Acidisoma cladoniae TaxID=3040935 RepID=UPI00254A3030|nr:hypothetical protein [Acidisoma sp. PAMC 29798]